MAQERLATTRAHCSGLKRGCFLVGYLSNILVIIGLLIVRYVNRIWNHFFSSKRIISPVHNLMHTPSQCRLTLSHRVPNRSTNLKKIRSQPVMYEIGSYPDELLEIVRDDCNNLVFK